MANKAIKYRVYPTTEQSIMFAKTFGSLVSIFISKCMKIISRLRYYG